jgi:hypothetical protein
MKIQDIVINCGFCGTKLKPFERQHNDKIHDQLCFACWTWFKTKMNDAGFKVDLEEEFL